ncbi:MAG: biopolymer transporter ExbD [Bacteroidales bacterium]|jgi:biopolymer transport protein ExbD|nr:biopolymer transporter ExbD [Bacteroidales bacterium]
MVKKSPTINGGSTADLAFLCLAFFMMTSSMDTDSGIVRRLPPPLDPNIKPPEIRERNVLQVQVNLHDQLRVNREQIDISELRSVTKDFLSNPFDDPHKPEKREMDIPGLGKFMVSRGVVSLQNDNTTSYEAYIRVQNELAAAINELRDALSRERFGVTFANLRNDELRDAIQRAIPMSISEAEPRNDGGQR